MKKKVLIILPIIIIFLLVLIIAILYFSTDIFKTNEELFWKYFAQNENILDTIKNDKNIIQNEFKSNNSYIENGKLTLVVEQGENSSKQLNIDTNAKHDKNTGRTYAEAILKNGNIDLFKISYINSNDIYAIKCDEVFNSYVGIRNSGLKEIAKNYEISNVDNIPDSINFNDYNKLVDLNNAQKEHLCNRYLPIIINNIPRNQYKKSEENIKIKDTTYNSNVYELQLTSNNVKNILLDSLNSLKEDSVSLEIISEKISILELGENFTDIDNLRIKIDELIENIKEYNFENDINILVYEYNGKTIKTIIQINEKMTITYNNIDNKKEVLLDIININNTFENINVNEEYTNEIIDLSKLEVNTSNTDKITRIIISEENLVDVSINKIEIIPDIKLVEKNVTITFRMGNIENDAINNFCTIIFNNFQEDKDIILEYNNNLSKIEDVEEITELSNANTALIENYPPNTFKEFIKGWIQIFDSKLKQKLETIGFMN